MTALNEKKAGLPLSGDYPDIEEGIESLKFVEACVASSHADGAWTPVG